MKLPVSEVLDSIQDVLKFDIKVRPQRLDYIQKEVDHVFVSTMNGLAGSVKPKFIRVEALFQEKGKKDKGNGKPNTLALKFIKKILSTIKEDNDHIGDFEDFNLSFVKDDGTEDYFQLIKGKQEIFIKCKTSSPGIPNSKEMYNKAKLKFDQYLNDRRNS